MGDIPEDWKDPDRTPIDFLVVGAGAGGAPLAARLVERGYTVLVVEMGPKKPGPAERTENAGNNNEPATTIQAKVDPTEVPLLHSESTEDPRHSLRFFVKHFDEDPDGSQDPKINPDLSRRDERGIFYPRAQGI